MKHTKLPFAIAAAAFLAALVITQQSDAQVTKPGGGFVPPGKISGGGGGGTITGVSGTTGGGLTGGGTSGAVTLGLLTSCSPNQILKWNGTAWACAADVDTDTNTTYSAGTGLQLVGTAFSMNEAGASCSAGQFVSAMSAAGAGTCTAETGDISAVAVATGGGLTGGATSGAATVGMLTTCSDQQVLKWTSGSTSWGCAADTDTNTTYSAGTGIQLAGTTFSLNEAGASCSAGQFVSAMSATGTGTCTGETGDIAGVTTAGTSGLSGGCTSGTCAVSMLTTCSDQQVLKWTSGTTSWGCAADTDTNTTYSAGTGIQLSGTTFSLNEAGASCSAGSFLSAMSATGTGTCTAEPGDISAVNVATGGGLTGGAASGAATVGMLTTCGDQQVLKWTAGSTSWGCAADTDTNTTYSAGTGIQLTGTTFSLNETGASCSAGSFISAMSATGVGTCTAEPGDIAGVTTAATSGLTGGCTSGTCAVSMLTTCSDTQVLKWNNGTSTWACAADADSGGDITSVVAGAGLITGGTSGAVTVDVGAGLGITVNANDVTIDPTYTQRRVSSSCSAGQQISAIAQDGTPTCSSGISTNLVYGTGIDGALSFDGFATVLGLAPSGSIYVLNRDIWATTLSIGNGVTIKTNGFRVFASTSITFGNSSSKITNNGNAAVTSTAGAGAPYGTIGGGSDGDTADGGTGGLTSAAGGTAFAIVNNPKGFTGNGGSGGVGGGGAAAGGGSTPTTAAAADGGGWSMTELLDFHTLTTGTSTTPLIAGRFACGGGGGGGGGGTNNGGGGGGGGGCLFVASPSITGAGAIEAKGGAGANGVNGAPNGSGGGGGGGGGLIVIVTTNGTPSYTTSAAGGGAGTAGTGGTAGAGVAGGTGYVATLVPGAGAGTAGFVSSITAGTGLSGGTITSSGTIALNMAGGTCTNGQAVTSISASGTATCGDVGNNSGGLYAGTHFELIGDEFLYPYSVFQSGNGNAVVGPWHLVGSSGGGINPVAGVTQRPGIAELQTNTTATTGRTFLATDPNLINFGDGTYTMEAVVAIPALSTAGDENASIVGIADTNSAVNQVDGCYFLYDRGNVATSGPNGGNASKWSIWCASNSTRTTYLLDGSTEGAGDGSFVTIDSPIAAVTYPNTNVYHLMITGNSSQVDFKINNTKVGQIKTNIPSGSTRLTGALLGVIKSAGTGSSRNLDVDFVRLAVDLTSARSP